MKGAPPFGPDDVDLVVSFAAQAGVVLEQERNREQAQRVTLLEDQERIARDLHDTVIQRLFASGLSLQGATRLITDVEARRRVEAAVEELDITVRHIRTVIFDVGASPKPTESVRSRVLDVTREAARAMGFEPRVTFDGPVDTALPASLADDIVASLREALSNVARHAQATSADVELAVASDAVLRVRDNGTGIDADLANGGRGLHNLRVRAERRGGTLRVVAGDPTGTVLEWRAPLTS